VDSLSNSHFNLHNKLIHRERYSLGYYVQWTNVENWVYFPCSCYSVLSGQRQSLKVLPAVPKDYRVISLNMATTKGGNVSNDFSFPFPPYDIQIDFMKFMYKCISENKIGLLESPTGTVRFLRCGLTYSTGENVEYNMFCNEVA